MESNRPRERRKKRKKSGTSFDDVTSVRNADDVRCKRFRSETTVIKEILLKYMLSLSLFLSFYKPRHHLRFLSALFSDLLDYGFEL